MPLESRWFRFMWLYSCLLVFGTSPMHFNSLHKKERKNEMVLWTFVALEMLGHIAVDICRQYYRRGTDQQGKKVPPPCFNGNSHCCYYIYCGCLDSDYTVQPSGSACRYPVRTKVEEEKNGILVLYGVYNSTLTNRIEINFGWKFNKLYKCLKRLLSGKAENGDDLSCCLMAGTRFAEVTPLCDEKKPKRRRLKVLCDTFIECGNTENIRAEEPERLK